MFCKKKNKLKNEIRIKNLKDINNFITEEIKIFKSEIDNVKNTSDILNLKRNIIDLSIYDFKNIDTTFKYECRCSNIKKSACKECIRESEKKVQAIYESTDNNIKKYNQCVSTIEDINYLINKSDDLRNIIVNFGYDKNDDLMCLIYNLKESLYCDKNDKIKNLYIVYGNLHKTKSIFKSALRINFKYIDDYMYISQIHASTDKMRCGHGSFALKNLENIIKYVNAICEQKDEARIIKKIKGDIKETKEYINRENLIRFYKNLGFNVYNNNFFIKEIY